MTDAALVVALANARAVRRPTHARRAAAHDALKDARSASELLGVPVDERQLDAVRALQRSVVGIVDALIDGTPPPLGDLNALAAREPVLYALERDRDGRLCLASRPARASAAAGLVLAGAPGAQRARAGASSPLRPPRVRAGVLRHHSLGHPALARGASLRA